MKAYHFVQVERIKNFGDVDKLAKADQYFAHIMKIQRLSERLDCMAYRRRVDLELEEIRPDLNTLRNASRELRNSAKFKQVLQVVLAIGNSLNGGTFRGGAQGFQLESLLKVCLCLCSASIVTDRASPIVERNKDGEWGSSLPNAATLCCQGSPEEGPQSPGLH